MAKGYFKKSKYTLIMFLAPPRKSSFGVAPIVFMLKNLYKSNGQLEKAKRQKKNKNDCCTCSFAVPDLAQYS